MQIHILLPVRRGGPYFQGQGLARELNKRGHLARHIHSVKELLLSPLYQDCDLVHASDIPIGLRFWKKPVVLKLMGNYRLEKNMWYSLYPIAIKMADIIVTVSNFSKRALGLTNAIVIPDAVNVKEFDPISYAEKEAFQILSITNFHFWEKAKGILEIIKILEKADVKRISKGKIRIIVLGDGKHLGRIKEIIKEPRIDVSFEGFKDPKDYLAISDIFLHCSYLDDFPNTILEAMASGLPVITNRIGAVDEIIDNTVDGYIAHNGDEYSNRMIELIDDPALRKQIGMQAREKVKQKFAWEKVVDQWIRVYGGLLEGFDGNTD